MRHCLPLFVLVVFAACKPEKKTPLSEDEQHLSQNALNGLQIADGLAVQVFATEPLLKNPTNIDVDEKGRVWVTEAYNYRPDITGNPLNEKGDRIVILEDTDGDAKADTAKVFYQGPELNAPLGIAVLGNRVIVCQSPYVWNFYDDNGDDKADRKEILFQGIGGEQHDHGIHAFTFGPDGKLYFNFGNSGKTLLDKNGKTVLDQDGEEIGPVKYKQGMVFRCNPDGSQIECLGQNFRNPFEVAVDSYGTLWQSDNDDDGNRGTRINFVMPYGNYGYTDEITCAGWSSARTNMEDSIPLRHWHLNDPGVVPNLLQTGAGSPTGILFYEGKLLPQQFQKQIIHCDAGPNVVRAYPTTPSGAGYTATILPILQGETDKWFRPADVCVAPDGSLIVADWYDPGVGGHQAGDQVRGRIYRVAPKNSADYKFTTEDYTTAVSAVKALQNPNLAVRHKAFTSLQAMGKDALPALETLWHSKQEEHLRARAFWALVKNPAADWGKYFAEALKDASPNIKILPIRASIQLNTDRTPWLLALVNDTSVQVKREAALALHHYSHPLSANLWSKLAGAYDGKDRWYLEALGIGADRQWDAFLGEYLKTQSEPLTNAAKDIVWRSRTESSIPLLTKFASDASQPLSTRLRYFRAFDFQPGTAKSKALLQILEQSPSNDTALHKLVLSALAKNDISRSAKAQQALQQLLKLSYGSGFYLDLIQRYELKSENNHLLELTLEKSNESLGRNAARLLLQLGGKPLLMPILNGIDTSQSKSLLNALCRVGTPETVDLVQQVAMAGKQPAYMKTYAAQRIGKSGEGEKRVLQLLKEGKVPADLIPDVVASVSGAWQQAVRTKAASYLPNHKEGKSAKLPTLAEVNVYTGNIEKGRSQFSNACTSCHMVGKEGIDFGPKLSQIGAKYDKGGLLKSILRPSEGISFGFEGWVLKMKDGSELVGLMVSKTETDIELKLPGGTVQKIKTEAVKTMEQMRASLMPEGLHEAMGMQGLSDLLAFLGSLK